MTSITRANTRYIATDSFSPQRSVTKPNSTRPNAMPVQKAEAHIPATCGVLKRTRSMKVTTQPDTAAKKI